METASPYRVPEAGALNERPKTPGQNWQPLQCVG